MQPDFHITADSKDITAAIAARLLELRVETFVAQYSDTLTLTLDDRDGTVALPRTGAELAVKLGYKSKSLAALGLFVVDEIALSSMPQRIVIKAHAANISSSQTRNGKQNTLLSVKTRAWENITIADMVAAIATEHGYTAKVSSDYANGALPALGAPMQYVYQHSESDLNLLTRLAHQFGAICKAVNGVLLFVPRGTIISASGQVLPVLKLSPSACTGWSVTMVDRGKYVAALAHYHDVASATRKIVRVGGSGTPVRSVLGTLPNLQAAQNAAKAALDSSNRGTTHALLTLVGDTSLSAVSPIQLQDFRTGVDGHYSITQCSHTLNSSGFHTQIKANRIL